MMMTVGIRFARGQAAAPAAQAKPAPPPTRYQVEQEAHQFAADLDDPNFDEAKLPKLMQQVFQDFRTVNQNMDPDQARQGGGGRFPGTRADHSEEVSRR